IHPPSSNGVVRETIQPPFATGKKTPNSALAVMTRTFFVGERARARFASPPAKRRQILLWPSCGERSLLANALARASRRPPAKRRQIPVRPPLRAPLGRLHGRNADEHDQHQHLQDHKCRNET